MYAAFGGHKAMVDALLEAGADINMKKPDGSAAFMAAALKGHKSVVEVLLEKGADIRAENNKGLTTAIIAKQKGYKEISELLEGMEFVFIKGGCFNMGDYEINEKPVHEVCLDDYYIGKYEVTQRQWTKVMGNNPSYFKQGDHNTVEQVSCYDLEVFLQKINQKTGQNYRLPTEAEWEYAARSGGKRVKWAGTNNESELERYA